MRCINDKRGRFRDYVQRRVVKQIIDNLIYEGKFDPNKNINLIIRIDQQGTSTDTNRAFINDIHHELTQGTYNYNYNLIFKPIVFSKLNIDLKYVVSHKHSCIQASDFIAGETRKIILNVEDKTKMLESLSFLNIKMFLP